MTNEPEDKNRGKAPNDESLDEERPTVTPPFDPVVFAQRVVGGKPSPAAGTRAAETGPGAPTCAGVEPPDAAPSGDRPPIAVARPPMPTLTDPAELEDARRRSATSSPPARRTPQGLLSLANARVPSDRAPRHSHPAAPSVEATNDAITVPPPSMIQRALVDATAESDEPSTNDGAAIVAATPMAGAAARSVPSTEPTTQEMHDRVALGDYSGALEVADKLLAINPADEPANACAESCRTVLRQMYTTRIGPLDRVPVVMVAREQMRWLSIDHRAGFVLSLVDGVSSVEMILDVSGMPELDALRILSELAQQRIVSFR